MKIFRFRANSHSYGYIRANWIEKFILLGRISGGDTGLISLKQFEIEFGRKAEGPRRYGANFLISAKKKSKCQLHVDLIKRNSIFKKKPVSLKRNVIPFFGTIIEWRIRNISFRKS